MSTPPTTISLHVGAVLDRAPGPKYVTSLSFAELAFRQPLPKPKVLGQMRRQLPDGFAFSLKAPRECVTSKQGALRMTPEVEASLAWLLAAADACAARAVVFTTPADFTPGARSRELLREFVARLPRPEGRHYVWLPHGVWEPEETEKLAADLGIVCGFDPLESRRPLGPVAYGTLRAMGHRTSFSPAAMGDALATLITADTREVFLSVDAERAFDVARRLKELATSVFADMGADDEDEDGDDDELDDDESDDEDAVSASAGDDDEDVESDDDDDDDDEDESDEDDDDAVSASAGDDDDDDDDAESDDDDDDDDDEDESDEDDDDVVSASAGDDDDDAESDDDDDDDDEDESDEDDDDAESSDDDDDDEDEDDDEPTGKRPPANKQELAGGQGKPARASDQDTPTGTQSKPTGMQGKSPNTQNKWAGNQSKSSATQGKSSGNQSKSSATQGKSSGNQSKSSATQGKSSGNQSKSSATQGKSSATQGKSSGKQSKPTGKQHKPMGKRDKQGR